MTPNELNSMNKGMICGQVTHAGKGIEKGYLWIDWIKTSQGVQGPPRTITYCNPVGIYTVNADTQANGCYALYFLWEGYDIGAAIDQLKFGVTCTARGLPGQPQKRSEGIFKEKVRLDIIAGHPSIQGLSLDVWKTIRQFKLPRTFLTRSALSTEMHSLVGVCNFYF